MQAATLRAKAQPLGEENYAVPGTLIVRCHLLPSYYRNSLTGFGPPCPVPSLSVCIGSGPTSTSNDPPPYGAEVIDPRIYAEVKHHAYG